ncbi:FAD-dependent thymidylate synthase [bacterium]|nr:FAD-dependent thymidylate synthase [bacterium]
MTFAKTSRSPDSFEEIARELSESESSRFHEKWVVGYGHSSVAEHAVLSIAIENISILGAKVVEENRLSSFTEKSTRYQVMAPNNYYTPPVFGDGEAGELYREAIASLYEAYYRLLPVARTWCNEAYGASEWRKAGLNPKGKACDAVRGLLPAAAKTNLGWTVNARSLRHGLIKMASSPLGEMRELAEELAQIGLARVPTLLKYLEPSPYLDGWEERMRRETSTSAQGDASTDGEPSVRLVEYDPDGEARVVAALLFRAGGCSYADARERAGRMSVCERRTAFAAAVDGMTDFELPVREFEETNYTFEVICDFGAYRDVQRHRMTTQTQQLLGCALGRTVPDDAREAGVADEMEQALDEARERWERLAESDAVHAQYAVPLAFHKRFLMTMNARAAFHFVRLRSRVQGHESYRRIAREMKREIERVHPGIGALIPVDETQSPAEFAARPAGA